MTYSKYCTFTHSKMCIEQMKKWKFYKNPATLYSSSVQPTSYLWTL